MISGHFDGHLSKNAVHWIPSSQVDIWASVPKLMDIYLMIPVMMFITKAECFTANMDFCSIWTSDVYIFYSLISLIAVIFSFYFLSKLLK